MSKCLYCYKELRQGEVDFHPECARKMFGTSAAPELPYSRDNMSELASKVIKTSTSVTGVQAKLSLEIDRGRKNEPSRFTIVGLWGNYILKPQSPQYRCLPELEDLTMKMAETAKIKTVIKYSIAPYLDVQKFWELVLFSWITGNSDMHCKNFSLLDEGEGYQLSPAYDLLAVLLADPNDTDELAMPIFTGGKTTGFDRDTFLQAFIQSGVPSNTAEKRIDRMTGYKDKWFELIDSSFLPEDLKSSYKNLITKRLSRL